MHVIAEPESYDLIIIGTGSGNAIPDFLGDRRIAIVERGVFGGTCINRGCVPSKMFVLPADLAEEARHAERLGLDIEVRGADWAAIRDRVFGRIDPISVNGREYRAHGSTNITLIEGTARFVEPLLLDVDGRRITAPKILVAAGSRPSIPDIAGLADVPYHTSDTIMRLEGLPNRLGVIGGGYIAVEMGHVFAAYGSEVTLFNRSDRLLRGLDHEISERFTEQFGRRVDLRLNRLPQRVGVGEGGIVIESDGETVVVDELLVATGRRPNSDLLDAELGGLKVDENGVIVVDEHMQAAEGVWAIGDIANEYQLKHVANTEAKVAFWNIAHPDELRSIDYSAVPAAVFSTPQVATVGMTEIEALFEGLDVAVGRRDYAGTAYGWALVDEGSFAKVIVDRDTRLIVGAHVIGPQASTLIQPLVQAMQFKQPADQIAYGQYWIHPALTEVLENALIDALQQIDAA